MFGGHGYNINQIQSGWRQTTCIWGQKTQILHPFQEIFIAKLKLIRRSKSYRTKEQLISAAVWAQA